MKKSLGVIFGYILSSDSSHISDAITESQNTLKFLDKCLSETKDDFNACLASSESTKLDRAILRAYSSTVEHLAGKKEAVLQQTVEERSG